MTPPRQKLFPLSEGVRGVAAIAVIVVHVWLFSGGFGGYGDNLANRFVVRLDGVVAVFFVLSAFLLYRPMIAHRGGGPAAPSVEGYARRRLLRIYPAYWLALTVLAIFPGLFGVFTGHWPAFYSLAINLDPIYDSGACPPADSFACGLPQAWTLTTEMTFYILLPLYAAVTGLIARRFSRHWLRLELCLVALLAILSVVLNADPIALREEPWFRFSVFGHFLWLGLGLALAAISVSFPRSRDLPSLLRRLAEHPALCWGAAVGVYLLTVFLLDPVPFIVADDSTSQFIATQLAHGLLATLIAIPVFFGDPNATLPRRLLGNRPIIWLGLISYGLYLWHVTIAYYLGFGGAEAGYLENLGLTLAIAIPLAALSYYLLERPLMRLKYRPLGELLRRRPRRAPP